MNTTANLIETLIVEAESAQLNTTIDIETSNGPRSLHHCDPTGIYHLLDTRLLLPNSLEFIAKHYVHYNPVIWLPTGNLLNFWIGMIKSTKVSGPRFFASALRPNSIPNAEQYWLTDNGVTTTRPENAGRPLVYRMVKRKQCLTDREAEIYGGTLINEIPRDEIQAMIICDDLNRKSRDDNHHYIVVYENVDK